MKPIEFEQQNNTIAKDQEEYQPLPAHVDNQGVVTSCWELDVDDMNEIQRNGKIYISMLTFGNPLQPISVSAVNPLTKTEKEEDHGK